MFRLHHGYLSLGRQGGCRFALRVKLHLLRAVCAFRHGAVVCRLDHHAQQEAAVSSTAPHRCYLHYGSPDELQRADSGGGPHVRVVLLRTRKSPSLHLIQVRRGRLHAVPINTVHLEQILLPNVLALLTVAEPVPVLGFDPDHLQSVHASWPSHQVVLHLRFRGPAPALGYVCRECVKAYLLAGLRQPRHTKCQPDPRSGQPGARDDSLCLHRRRHLLHCLRLPPPPQTRRQ